VKHKHDAAVHHNRIKAALEATHKTHHALHAHHHKLAADAAAERVPLHDSANPPPIEAAQ
jgi:hypothetical protein